MRATECGVVNRAGRPGLTTREQRALYRSMYIVQEVQLQGIGHSVAISKA